MKLSVLKNKKGNFVVINNLTFNPYVKNNFNIQNTAFKKKKPSFCGVQSLTHTNIGMCAEGFIGKIRVRLAGGGESFLNVFKNKNCDWEEYKVMDDFNNLIGESQIKIKKFVNYGRFEYKSDPSHVFVDTLRNYSTPGTPYHNKALPYYKDIGTRLLQIAQRRSDESNCCGNIKLIAKNESKPFYKNAIHMCEESTFTSNLLFRFGGNRNMMYLPPEWKEPLSRLHGGL